MKEDMYKDIKKLYQLLVCKFNEQKTLTVEEVLLAVPGWKISTVKTYISKKLKNILIKEGNAYKVVNIESYDEDSFLNLMSQTQIRSQNPHRRKLSEIGEILLHKAIESAFLAVDIYNRPQTKFRSDGYIVMMIIAWTSLFHAIFQESNIDYYYKDRKGNYELVKGDKKTWELQRCIENTDKINEAVKSNLKMMIGLRNKIEHQFVPEIDLEICGECQAMLMNFEELLTVQFGKGYALATNIAIPLQLMHFNEGVQKTRKEFQNKNFNEIKEYIGNFRNALSEEIYNDPHYSFKVYLVPKIINNANRNALAIEFIDAKALTEEEYGKLSGAIAFVKEKIIEAHNTERYKPSAVAMEVEQRIGKKFRVYHHTKAWKYYAVRKSGQQAIGCNTKYCHFDELHKDYSYTDAWINFLVKELSDKDQYDKVMNYDDQHD